jgi:hypothetical protein
MDESESLVRDHLLHLGFDRIVYEPDGSNPPDFLIDDRIAVEVRRLNQNEVIESGRLRGLEEDHISTVIRLRRLLLSLGPAKSGGSWFVEFKLRRPIPRWSQIEPELRSQLETFRDDESRQKVSYIKIADGLKINIFQKASDPHPTCFVHGITCDSDVGGFPFVETQKNLRLCIEEKTRKIARVRHKYPEWWLVFVDRINFGMDASDQKLFREQLGIDHNFDKVILLSPLDTRRAFEVPRKTTAVEG